MNQDPIHSVGGTITYTFTVNFDISKATRKEVTDVLDAIENVQRKCDGGIPADFYKVKEQALSHY